MRICFAVFLPRRPHETYTQYTRSTLVIYLTEILHKIRHITPLKETELTHKDATTKEKFPEASPKGPGLQHFRAIAGQRINRTLGLHGLASRPHKLENLRPLLRKNAITKKKKPLTPLPLTPYAFNCALDPRAPPHPHHR